MFAVTKSKNNAYCRVYHFQRIFHFLGLNWSLNDLKNNFGPSKGTDIH